VSLNSRKRGVSPRAGRLLPTIDRAWLCCIPWVSRHAHAKSPSRQRHLSAHLGRAGPKGPLAGGLGGVGLVWFERRSAEPALPKSSEGVTIVLEVLEGLAFANLETHQRAGQLTGRRLVALPT